jgi:hypothetical protein
MPCTTTVDPKVDYKLHNSAAFRFPAGPPLDLIADSGGHHVFAAIGGTMIGLSAVGVVFGSLVMANVFASVPMATTAAEDKANQQTRNGDTVAGIVVLGISAAVCVVGVVFLGIHPPSSLTTTAGVRIVKRSGPALTPRGLVF